jgi:hypothetical protein
MLPSLDKGIKTCFKGLTIFCKWCFTNGTKPLRFKQKNLNGKESAGIYSVAIPEAGLPVRKWDKRNRHYDDPA